MRFKRKDTKFIHLAEFPGRRERSMGRTETAMWTEPTKHSCAKGFPVNWSSTKSRVTRSICRQTRSANVAPPWEEKRVPILEKVTTCVQPPTYQPPHILPHFLPRARVCVRNIQNSENVRLPKVQKYSTLPLFLFFRWKVHLCCRSCSLLVASCAQIHSE